MEDNRTIPWQQGTWTNHPSSIKEQDGSLTVEAQAQSDYWQKTYYGFERSSGHALLDVWPLDRAIEVGFLTGSFVEKYDQAGLMMYLDNQNWIKAGVEMNDGVPHIGAVVTKGHSDWSLFPVPDWAGRKITIRASYFEGAIIIRAKADEGAWQTIRVSEFPKQDNQTLQAGPFICSPERAGFTTTFVKWASCEKEDDLHAEIPK